MVPDGWPCVEELLAIINAAAVILVNSYYIYDVNQEMKQLRGTTRVNGPCELAFLITEEYVSTFKIVILVLAALNAAFLVVFVYSNTITGKRRILMVSRMWLLVEFLLVVFFLTDLIAQAEGKELPSLIFWSKFVCFTWKLLFLLLFSWRIYERHRALRNSYVRPTSATLGVKSSEPSASHPHIARLVSTKGESSFRQPPAETLHPDSTLKVSSQGSSVQPKVESLNDGKNASGTTTAVAVVHSSRVMAAVPPAQPTSEVIHPVDSNEVSVSSVSSVHPKAKSSQVPLELQGVSTETELVLLPPNAPAVVTDTYEQEETDDKIQPELFALINTLPAATVVDEKTFYIKTTTKLLRLQITIFRTDPLTSKVTNLSGNCKKLVPDLPEKMREDILKTLRNSLSNMANHECGIKHDKLNYSNLSIQIEFQVVPEQLEAEKEKLIYESLEILELLVVCFILSALIEYTEAELKNLVKQEGLFTASPRHHWSPPGGSLEQDSRRLIQQLDYRIERKHLQAKIRHSEMVIEAQGKKLQKLDKALSSTDGDKSSRETTEDLLILMKQKEEAQKLLKEQEAKQLQALMDLVILFVETLKFQHERLKHEKLKMRQAVPGYNKRNHNYNERLYEKKKLPMLQAYY